MSDPTIRLSTCRGTGCPECGRYVPYSGGLLPTLCGCRVCSSGCFSQHERRLLTEALRKRDARISAEALHAKIDRYFDDIRPLSDAAGWSDPFDFLIHETWKRDPKVVALLGERDAAIRQVEEQRHPCPCGKDTASIKWARCYSCRQRDTEELEVMREERDAAIREMDDLKRKVEEMEETIDFGVSVTGELRSQIEELRAANLKLRQDLRKENNEFQDLKVQYEQRENEVIQLRKEHTLVDEKATAWDLLTPDRERAFKLLEGTPSVMPGMSWAHCLCEEVERLRRVLKLTEALVPTHVPIKKYEEARREIEGLRSLQRRVEKCLREHYAAHRGDARSVNGPAREVIESIAKELGIGL